MKKIFFNYIASRVSEKMKIIAPEFALAKAPARYNDSLLLRWEPLPKLACFIHVLARRADESFRCNVQWSKLGRFPVEMNTVEATQKIFRHYRIIGSEKITFDDFDEMWFNSGNFDYPNRWDIPNPKPPEDILNECFANQMRKWNRVIGGLELYDWNMVVAAYKDLKMDFQLTEAHAEFAVGSLAPVICDFIENQALPYLRSFVERMIEQGFTSHCSPDSSKI